jgi:hypothetical protein
MYRTKTAPIEFSGVHLHGWDAQTETWFGPIPLPAANRGTRQVLARLRSAGSGFQGKVMCSVPGLPCMEFRTAVYDLRDSGLAIVHLDGVHSGPAGIMAVVPRTRRRLLRNDFAFELTTLISFLGSPINHGCELAMHDYIEEVLRTERSATQVFAAETAELSSDTAIVLSAHFERLAAAMLVWMETRESQDGEALEAGEFGPGTAILAGRTPAALPTQCYAV